MPPDPKMAYKHPDGRTTDMDPDTCGETAAKLVLLVLLSGAVLVQLAQRLLA